MPNVIMLTVFMPNVIMLTVFMPNVIMLNVVAPFIVPLKSLYNKNFGLVKQKCIFGTYKKFKTGKKSLNVIISVVKKLILFAFSVANVIKLFTAVSYDFS
jgi:hypothetical protein